MGSSTDERSTRRPYRAGRDQHEGVSRMPRYIVERTFSDGTSFPTPTGENGRNVVARDVGTFDDRVTWVHSYVSDDERRSFCVYDAPSAEAIEALAQRDGQPVDRITEVGVLDPYLALGASGR